MVITFGDILELGIKRLQQAEITDSERDAQSLLLFLMHETRNFLFLHRNDAADENHLDAYFELIDRRAAGEPLQYIVGEQEFMGLPFKVDESVLIPRQDTESLVEAALETAKQMKPSISILDMCCGSGAIAVSMAHFLPKAKITACDISEQALAVARQNAEINGHSKSIEFVHSNMFNLEKKKKVTLIKGKFEMILCNPPYIPSHVIPTLQKEICEHEPLTALDGGVDGLDFYRILAAEAGNHLKKQGVILMEIGSDQANEVTALFETAQQYVDVKVHKDLAGMDRVVSCMLKPAE